MTKLKIKPVKEAKERFTAVLEEAQREKIVVTRHGRPVALIVGVEGEALEDLLLREDDAFWAELRHRRSSPTVSEEEARRRLGIRGSTKKPRRAPKKR